MSDAHSILWSVLYSERKRLDAIKASEAAGETLWTDRIPHPVLVRIGHVWELLGKEGYNLDRAIEERMEITFRQNGT